jgi:LemA protein
VNSGVWFFAFIIALFFIAGALAYTIQVFNSFIQVKNNVGKAWANIDVLLLQRNEELMKLLDLCKSYMMHEKDLLTSLAMLRSSYQNSNVAREKIRIENKIETSIQTLFMTGEQYPDLKADRIVRTLMQQISTIEENIRDRRVFFNESVAIYNTQIQKIPYLLFAKMLRYKPFPYLEIPAVR